MKSGLASIPFSLPFSGDISLATSTERPEATQKSLFSDRPANLSCEFLLLNKVVSLFNDGVGHRLPIAGTFYEIVSSHNSQTYLMTALIGIPWKLSRTAADISNE